MTDKLVAFLRARLKEDEEAALAWPDGQRSWRRVGHRLISYDNGCHEDCSAISVNGDEPLAWDRIRVMRDSGHPGDLAAHIARHDPARVIREIAAKRAILDEHAPITSRHADGIVRDTCMACQRERPGFAYPCPTLRHLAAVYAGRDGYEEAIKP